MEKTIGKRIADLRKKSGMTQAELAGKLNVTDKAVSKWERDISCPDISLLPKIAALFSISLDELMQGASYEKQNQEESRKDLIVLILRAIALASGVAVAVLSAMTQTGWQDLSALLGGGMACLAASLFVKGKD